MNTKVSVILPNFNYARYLPQRIESILNQTFQDFELIILDDASTDNSIEIIKKYKKQDHRIKTIYNNENSGNPFVQWQKGIEQSKGEYIWVAEADDYCEDTLLEELVNILIKNSDIGIAYANSYIIDEKGSLKNTWFDNSKLKKQFENDFIKQGPEFIENLLVYENVIPNASAVLFRKGIYKEIGGVDTTIRNCADWLLWLKMLYENNVAFIAEPLNYFRRHEKSVINTAKQKVVESGMFHEYYSLTMRLKLKKWLGYNKLNSKIHYINNNYIADDLGNKIKWAKKNEGIIKAIKYAITAFLYSNFSFSYLKRFFI